MRGTHRMQSMPNAHSYVMCWISGPDLISRIIFVSEEDSIHPSSCTRRERHGERCETSTEILCFTTLRRDEGYQSLELSSDNKLETSLLRSNAFFYVRNRHQKNYYIPSENRMISWQSSVKERCSTAMRTGIMSWVLQGNFKVRVETHICCSMGLNVVDILLNH
jgi:hypothetical protein